MLPDPIQRTVGQLKHEIPDLDELAAEVHLIIARAYGVYFAALAGRYDELGLSVPRFNTLRWLYHADDEQLTLSELSAHLEASLPTVMRMVRVLEEDGWIRRRISQSDRRVTFVELTADGRAKFAPLLERAANIWSEIWSGLETDEKSTLAYLLSKLRSDLLKRYIGYESLLPYKLDRLEQQKDGRGYSPRTPA